jgi:hypothetical protein
MGAALELPEYPIMEHMSFHFQSRDICLPGPKTLIGIDLKGAK